jgi:tRNA (cmo5U34)-methyltransferase
MNKILKHFSKTVDDYDTVADKVVFENNELHQCLVGAISFKKNQALNILDLGCGTGHGMKLMAKLFSRAKITGVDFSPKMISYSKKHLVNYSSRINLIEGDFNLIDFGQNYDVIVSAIAIHNSKDSFKKILFTKIFKALKNNGIFINADFYAGETKKLNEYLKEIYRNFVEQNLSGHELKVWLKHAFEEDIPMSLSKHFLYLKKSGI